MQAEIIQNLWSVLQWLILMLIASIVWILVLYEKMHNLKKRLREVGIGKDLLFLESKRDAANRSKMEANKRAEYLKGLEKGLKIAKSN